MPLVSRSIESAPERVVLVWTMPLPPARVWWGLTDSEALPHWLGPLLSGEFVPGDVVTIRHAEDYFSTSTIQDCIPEQLLVMSWEFPDEPCSVLRIGLTGVGRGTHLELIHEGLGTETANYLPGWHTHLLYLEAMLSGKPLAPEEFWPTYLSGAR